MLPSARTGTLLVALLSVACAVAAVLLVMTAVRPAPPHVRTPEVQIGRSVAPEPTVLPSSVLPPPPPLDDDEDD